jgi:hypothetical protein
MHSSSGFGAIAQLGERVLCKHEVVGSIPSGSTSFRWQCQLRLGKPIGARAADRSSCEDELRTKRQLPSSAETSLRIVVRTGRDCGIYDIVKRRSIRVWDLRSNSQHSNHYLRDISALAHRKMIEL